MKLSYEQFKSLAKESWKVSWPMVLIMLFEFFMGVADVYVAGRVSSLAQAAYGLAFQIYFVFLIPTMAFTTGTVVFVSKLFSAWQISSDSQSDQNLSKKELRQTASSSLIGVTIAGAVACVVGFVTAPFLISIMHVPLVIKPLAIKLLRVYVFALMFEYPLINASGILRSCGLIKRSLLAMTFACCLNIVLNFYFVLYTPLKITGIAWATLISLVVALLINIKPVVNLVGIPSFFDFTLTKKIFSVGWPIGIMQILWNTAYVALVAILGSLPENRVEIIAAFTAGLKVESVIFLPVFAFNMANAVVTGNMLGRNEKQLAYKAGFVTAGIGVALVAVLSAIVVFNAKSIIEALSTNDLVVKNGMTYIYISLLFEPLMALGVILGGALSGAGYTKDIMFITGISVWLIRIPLCYLCAVSFGFGALGVWWAMNASVVVQSILTIRQYRFRMRYS